MLILSRKIGEKIRIGEDIEIVVVDITSLNQVKIGINAPKNIPILREEVYLRIQQENIKASTSTKDDLPDSLNLGQEKSDNSPKKEIITKRRSNGN